jgi:hypothetical protein
MDFGMPSRIPTPENSPNFTSRPWQPSDIEVKGRDFLYTDAYLEEQHRFTSLADYRQERLVEQRTLWPTTG